jgi:hypothetical protein
MQISASLIAAQQAAREAQSQFQARFQAAAPQSTSKTGFSAALQSEGGFAPLPLKQVAPSPSAPPMSGRPGSLLDIKV